MHYARFQETHCANLATWEQVTYRRSTLQHCKATACGSLCNGPDQIDMAQDLHHKSIKSYQGTLCPILRKNAQKFQQISIPQSDQRVFKIT